MTHSTPSAFGLQSLLFSKEELSSCFFRDPTDRELEFMSYFHGIQSLLSPDELLRLRKLHNRGRIGYSLIAMLGIQELSERDRRVVLRARKLQRYLTQPFHVTAEHAGMKGVTVPLKETLADCEEFLRGGFDGTTEEECYMRGAMGSPRP